MTRLLIVSSEFPPGPGGIGTHASELAKGLARRGWDVAVLTRQDYASAEEIAAFNAAQPFRIIRLRPVSGAPLEAVYRGAVLGRWIASYAPEVLVASGERSVMLTAARRTGRRLPFVAVGHGSEFGLRGWERAAVRWSFEQATTVVCVSEFTRRQMHVAGVKPRSECVIPNGADPERFRVVPEAGVAALRAELNLEGARLILTVGNVTRRKGQDVVVRALPAILERIPSVHYIMAGLPTLGDSIRKLAEELGVAGQVHLLGRVDDGRLVQLLNAADVFVMTSRHTQGGDFEGYGIAAVEAALCGRPAVVSADSGLAEAVTDGQTGLLVPQEDPGAAARAIVRLLENDALRREMGEAARRRAEKDQTWSGRVDEYDSLLRRLIAAEPREGEPRVRPKIAV